MMWKSMLFAIFLGCVISCPFVSTVQAGPLAWYSVDGVVTNIDDSNWIVDGGYHYLGFSVSNAQFSLTASATGKVDPYLSYDLTVANRTDATHSYAFGVSTPIAPITTASQVSAFFAGSMTDATGNGIAVTPNGPDYDLDGVVEMQANFLNGLAADGVNMGVDVGVGKSLPAGLAGQSIDIGGMVSGPQTGPLPGPAGNWNSIGSVVSFSLTGDRDHTTLNGQVGINPVPEPQALFLLGLGLAGMSGAYLRRRRG
jgi:hypothetical protein